MTPSPVSARHGVFLDTSVLLAGAHRLRVYERAEAVAVASSGSKRTRVWQAIAVLALIIAAAFGVERWPRPGSDAIADVHASSRG